MIKVNKEMDAGRPESKRPVRFEFEIMPVCERQWVRPAAILACHDATPDHSQSRPSLRPTCGRDTTRTQQPAVTSVCNFRSELLTGDRAQRSSLLYSSRGLQSGAGASGGRPPYLAITAVAQLKIYSERNVARITS